MTGRQLKKWRKGQRLTLVQLGAMLDLAPASLSRYERDLLPVPKLVELACEFLPHRPAA